MPLDLYPHHLATWSRPVLEAAIRRRVQSAYLGDGLVLARILGRHKIFLRSTDRGFACHLMLDGFWEMWLTQFLARQVKAGMRVIDIGANFGYFTLLLGDAVGTSGCVIAVEPNPETAGLLRETVLLNGHAARTRIVDKALSDATGTAWLFSPDSEPKNATLVGRPNMPGGRTFDIPTVALDDIALEGPRVDLVKIDAEGAEVSIVQGMRRLIERDRPMIVLEFNPSRYAEPSQFLDGLLASYGTARQLALDGTIVPLDKDAVLDRSDLEDRILLFESHA
jgi:FkbM family methyltransferase